MANPITADQLLSQLKRWKVPYREIDGWRTRGRDSATGLTFGPVYGGLVHHTGDDAPDHLDRQVIINGRSDLPGPLSQFGGNDDGVIDLISIRRCNHAGGGDPAVLRAVRLENYGDYPPDTGYHQGESGAVDGNDSFYGIENYYSGGKPMTDALYNSNLLLWAAICEFHGWSAKSIIGHKEWSDWKWDPGKIDMKVFRSDLQEVLNNGPDGRPHKPQFLTPNITAAIAMNVRYDKATDKITLPAAQDVKAEIRAALKAQRKSLRALERRKP